MTPEPSKVIRQFSLIHALLASRVGLTVDQILATVDGYRDTFDPYSSTAVDSVTKSFERDKKEIRNLGIVIQTRTPMDAPEDNHGMRYLIDPSTFVLPDDITFSRAEIALLNLAARAWQHGSMSKDALRAINKLRSLGIEADGTLSGVRPRISGWDDVVDHLGDILGQSGIAEFSYLKPGTLIAETRRAAPVALTEWKGLWYMLAWDVDRDAERTFLVSRVTTLPRMIPQSRYDSDGHDYATRLANELDDRAQNNVAQISVMPLTDAELRLGAKYGAADGDGVIHVPTADLDLLADELVEYGADVSVVQPDTLRFLVRKRFERIAAAHGGAA